MHRADYARHDIIAALQSVGISAGDRIFVHSNLGFFGRLKDCDDQDCYYRTFKSAIFKVLTEKGTLVVPTFTMSYCWNQVYDKKTSKSISGMLAEMLRQDPEALRSDDGNFSIAAIGPDARRFTEHSPEHSFGPGSFWKLFLESGGKFCNFNFDSASTFIHYVERTLNVSYRYDKGFPGKSVVDGREVGGVFYHFVYDLEKPAHAPDFTKFDKRAKEEGLSRVAKLGKGTVLAISARDTFALIERELKRDPAFLITGEV
jgi:aminoglycoside 3-N-acetyltransferase